MILQIENETKKFDEFLKNRGNYKKKLNEKISLFDKFKSIKERLKNKVNDQQYVQMVNIVKKNPNIIKLVSYNCPIHSKVLEDTFQKVTLTKEDFENNPDLLKNAIIYEYLPENLKMYSLQKILIVNLSAAHLKSS